MMTKKKKRKKKNKQTVEDIKVYNSVLSYMKFGVTFMW